MNGLPTGGFWSGHPAIDSSGVFDPSQAGPGTHIVQYSIGSGTCLNIDSTSIVVNPLPSLQFTPTNPNPCEGEDIAIGVSGATSYQWSPSTGLDTTSGNTVVANLATDTTYFVTATDSNNCTNTDSIFVDVNPLPNVTAQDTTICNQASFNVQLTGLPVANPPDGIWTSDSSNINLTSSGVFTPGGAPSDTGTFPVLYTYTDQNGCTDTSNATVNVIEPVYADAGDPDTTCLNSDIDTLENFTPTSGGTWTGAPVIDQELGVYDPSTVSPGTYTLIYSYGSGTCVTRDTTTLTVQPLPNPHFTFNITCEGETTYFQDASIPNADSIVSYDWSFGDGNSSTQQNPSHTYQSDSTYQVNLTVLNNNGCRHDTTINVTVHPLPTVGFDHADTSCVGDSVSFELDTIDAVSYNWHFGDGETATGANPNHIYDTSGTFTIKLVAETQYGCVDSSFSTIVIPTQPFAGFNLNPKKGCGPLDVSFFPAQFPMSGFDYQWTFGQEDTIYNWKPDTISFPAPYAGDTAYPVIFSVYSNKCQTIDTSHAQVRVKAKPNAEMEAKPGNGCHPLHVELLNQTIGPADSIYLDFGDGKDTVLKGNPNTIPHVYQNLTDKDTVFTAQVVGFNDCGKDTASVPVTVYPNTVNAGFSVDTTEGCKFTTFTFDNVARGGTYIYYNFDDGSKKILDTSRQFQYTYTEAGTYTVVQEVYSGDSCSVDRDSITITIHSSPANDYEAVQDSYQCRQPFPVTFNNYTSGAESYLWQFGDSLTSTEKEPTHPYDTSGLFETTLISENRFNCKDTLRKDVFVQPPKNVLLVPNALSPEAGSGETNYFLPKGVCLESYKIEIYNTWGELIWESSKLTDDGRPAEAWKGMCPNGSLCPQDVYVWKIQAVFQDGTVWQGKEYSSKNKKRVGSVTLLR